MGALWDPVLFGVPLILIPPQTGDWRQDTGGWRLEIGDWTNHLLPTAYCLLSVRIRRHHIPGLQALDLRRAAVGEEDYTDAVLARRVDPPHHRLTVVGKNLDDRPVHEHPQAQRSADIRFEGSALKDLWALAET